MRTDGGRERRRGKGYLGYKLNTDMEINKWEDSQFTKKIRISESNLEYIRKIKKKRGLAGMLDVIIRYYKKYGDAPVRKVSGK